MLRADLHLHTTASDGALHPEALMALSRRRGLNGIAITDHDTTAGLEIALAKKPTDLFILPGLELACALGESESAGREIDILAYDFDHQDPTLRQTLQRLRSERISRAKAILARLHERGMAVSWRQILRISAGESIGRPHIAQAMVDSGHVATLAEAFERYLQRGAPAHVPRWCLTAEEGITLIHDTGGVAVLAHPGKLLQYQAVIQSLIPLGLDGIEIIHPQHDTETTALLRRMAQHHRLLVTGGSDFHRPTAAGEVALGRFLAPPRSVESIRKRAELHRLKSS